MSAMQAAPNLAEDLLETWRINLRLNLILLDALSPEQLSLKAPKSKSVGGHFSHIHNVRLMWLKASAPELLEGLAKLQEDTDGSLLRTAHEASGEAVGQLLTHGLEKGKVKNFKPHPTAFLGYLLAHDAYHRSQIELVLRQCDAPLPDKVAYGLWEWGGR